MTSSVQSQSCCRLAACHTMHSGVTRSTHDRRVDMYCLAHKICHVLKLCLQFACIYYIFLWFSVFLFAAKYILKYTLDLKCYVMTRFWQKRGFSRGCPNFLTLNQYIEV